MFSKGVHTKRNHQLSGLTAKNSYSTRPCLKKREIWFLKPLDSSVAVTLCLVFSCRAYSVLDELIQQYAKAVSDELEMADRDAKVLPVHSC